MVETTAIEAGIATFKRPHALRELLESLRSQQRTDETCRLVSHAAALRSSVRPGRGEDIEFFLLDASGEPASGAVRRCLGDRAGGIRASDARMAAAARILCRASLHENPPAPVYGLQKAVMVRAHVGTNKLRGTRTTTGALDVVSTGGTDRLGSSRHKPAFLLFFRKKS